MYALQSETCSLFCRSNCGDLLACTYCVSLTEVNEALCLGGQRARSGLEEAPACHSETAAENDTGHEDCSVLPIHTREMRIAFMSRRLLSRRPGIWQCQICRVSGSFSLSVCLGSRQCL